MNPASDAAITFVLRADGDQASGYGHVIRMLAFAETMKQAIEAHLVCRNPDAFVLEASAQVAVKCVRLEVQSCDEEVQFLANLAGKSGMIFLDGYGFNTEYQQALLKTGAFFWCFDDHQNRHYAAHVVIRLAASAPGNRPVRRWGSRYVQGISYALLRASCFEKYDSVRTPDEWLLIPGNGNNATQFIEEVLKALVQLAEPPRRLTIVQSGDLPKLPDYIQQTSIVRKVMESPHDFLKQLNQAGQLICLASTVALEAIAIGRNPILVAFTPAQEALKQELQRILPIRSAQPLASELIEQIQTQEGIIPLVMIRDQIRKRYLKLLNSCRIEQQFVLRNAHSNDEDLLLIWANHPDVRRNAIQSETISPENHHRWFQNRLNDPNTFLFIGLWNNLPVGQVRFDRHEDLFEIDYSVDETQRGKGFGEMLIRQGMEALALPENTSAQIIGLVKPENIASQEVFRKLGFIEEAREHRKGIELHRFVFKQGC